MTFAIIETSKANELSNVDSECGDNVPDEVIAQTARYVARIPTHTLLLITNFTCLYCVHHIETSRDTRV